MPSSLPVSREAAAALPAGRELDALVAVHVLGWVEIDFRGQRCFEHADYHKPMFEHPATGVVVPQGPLPAVLFDDPSWPPLPRYSTDIATAWQLVEKLAEREEYRRFELTQYGSARAANRLVFLAAFGLNDYMEADTVPLAICRAALLAVSAE